jgi:hypothetical protein
MALYKMQMAALNLVILLGFSTEDGGRGIIEDGAEESNHNLAGDSYNTWTHE